MSCITLVMVYMYFQCVQPKIWIFIGLTRGSCSPIPRLTLLFVLQVWAQETRPVIQESGGKPGNEAKVVPHTYSCDRALSPRILRKWAWLTVLLRILHKSHKVTMDFCLLSHRVTMKFFQSHRVTDFFFQWGHAVTAKFRRSQIVVTRKRSHCQGNRQQICFMFQTGEYGSILSWMGTSKLFVTYAMQCYKHFSYCKQVKVIWPLVKVLTTSCIYIV